MKEIKGRPHPGAMEPLTLRVAPALSEYLRREAASQAVDPADLASRLLMRGLHAERLDEFADALAVPGGQPEVTDEARMAAGLEAAALLGSLWASRGARMDKALLVQCNRARRGQHDR